jgi:hypothetical protein
MAAKKKEKDPIEEYELGWKDGYDRAYERPVPQRRGVTPDYVFGHIAGVEAGRKERGVEPYGPIPAR